MDFMKVFDQTVREIKREVNLKVLKVPEIEQKVLDATDDEPWGPHGSALAEIAQATKKFTECQMVMNVLWTRLHETGKDWRYVYKALAVIEYLVAHGSERAVDDIIEHTFQISSLSSFEYVEPSGKDLGINVRKKAENIVALLNDKDKIQEVRNKAAANRDKYVLVCEGMYLIFPLPIRFCYDFMAELNNVCFHCRYFGLSSTGMSYKSSAASYGSGGFGSSDRHRGTRDSERFNDSYNEEYTDSYKKSVKKKQVDDKESAQDSSKSESSSASKPSKELNGSARHKAVLSQNVNAPSSNYEDDFDDFDPRGTSTTKSSAVTSNQVDFFGDLLDAPLTVDPVPSDVSSMNKSLPDSDLFADAAFVSAPPAANSQKKTEIDLFSSIPAQSPPIPPTVDLFSNADPVVSSETKSVSSVPSNTSTIDPFAAVPLNNFDGSDPFGDFTFTKAVSTVPFQNETEGSGLGNLSAIPSVGTNTLPAKKDNFHVKSGIWADSLSRGIIDLNISASKKVSLADVGVVGALSDGSDERDKGPAASYSMGRAMGSGSGLGKSGFTPAQSTGIDDFFSSFANQPYQYNSAKK
ncbi:hypothetical protein SAY86_029646 [Trapa natans]|uniref:ENTH domain-containing protein n=1 Tax=Trapa natans TaxID=22666 RepID=A0AAN7MIH6_TRANT|nr:hypothetical protein SAY86_029646 [Trapa natans]